MTLSTNDPPNSRSNSVVSDRTGRAHRPTRANVIGLIICLIGGVLAAAVAAAGAFAWVNGELPLVLFLPMVGQGVGVGLVLAWLFRRNKIRRAAATVVIAVICGVASAACFHLGLYVRNAILVRDQLKHDWRQLGMDQTPQGKQTLDQLESHPLDLFDRTVIFPRTGHHGFFGYLIVRGAKVQVFALVQMLIIVWLGVALGKPFSGQKAPRENLPARAPPPE